jgi:hypothetical protein
MRKFFVGFVAAVALTVSVPLLAHNDKGPKPKKPNKLAAELCVAAMESGAYQTQTADQLGDYCVALAVFLTNADYTAP